MRNLKLVFLTFIFLLSASFGLVVYFMPSHVDADPIKAPNETFIDTEIFLTLTPVSKETQGPLPTPIQTNVRPNVTPENKGPLNPNFVLSKDQIEIFALEAGWPIYLMEDVLCLVNAESSNRPYIVREDGDPDYGLTQINQGWFNGFEMADGTTLPPFAPEWSESYLMDPVNNLQAAWLIYQRNNNFNHWPGYLANCTGE